MAKKLTIAVFGATGAQGGSVANTFLHDAKLKNDWTVRAVTRDITKPSAAKLREQGAEVVSADMNSPATLLEAMTGAYAVYAVTNYWESLDAAVEERQGKALADAAITAGVQHFIFSSLMNMSELSKGRLPHIHHFDSKAHVESYIRTTPLPATFFMPGFYMPNIVSSQMRLDADTGAWTFSLPVPPATRIPLFNPADTGKFVAAAVLQREATLGRRILGASEYLTCEGVVEGFRRAFPESGRGARYKQVGEGEYRDKLVGKGMRGDVAQEVLENMLMLVDPGYYGGEGLEESLALVRGAGFGVVRWEEFVKGAKGWEGLR
ncbi:NmrA-like family-domain-containing protein [Podospora conica]|nr:NmrA-like family-domain-containing protein [Schizothecium conicum]